MTALSVIFDVVGLILLLLGVAIFTIEMIGIIKYDFLLNRMHVAGMGDTLGISLCLLGLICINGLDFNSLKLFLVIVFLWFSSPTSSHLISELEATTDEKIEDHVKMEVDRKEITG